QAYLKLGIAYFNQHDNNNALNNFKKLISTYPNAEESDEAVNYVRNIFIETQRPGDFVAFMRGSGKDVSNTEEDSLTYVSASLAYNSKSYDDALKGFANYLQKFPNGEYAVD